MVYTYLYSYIYLHLHVLCPGWAYPLSQLVYKIQDPSSSEYREVQADAQRIKLYAWMYCQYKTAWQCTSSIHLYSIVFPVTIMFKMFGIELETKVYTKVCICQQALSTRRRSQGPAIVQLINRLQLYSQVSMVIDILPHIKSCVIIHYQIEFYRRNIAVGKVEAHLNASRVCDICPLIPRPQ